MKTTFSKLALPLLAVLFAVTAAFSTSYAHGKESAKAIKIGYLQHPGAQVECEAIEDCSTTVSATFCRVGQVSSGARLWDMNSQSKCTVPLYKPL
jgi:hypothetical protein